MRAPYNAVVERFNADLFTALAPAFPPMQLHRHDAIAVGGEVHLSLGWSIFRQSWVSAIVAVEREKNRWYFIDEGVKLPFPLRQWRHMHAVIADGPQWTVIQDDIRFATGWKVLDIVLRPVFRLLFSQRKAKYVAYFEQ